MRQALAVTVQYDAVAREFIEPVQLAGLSLGLIEICKNDAETPDALRRSLVRQLQRTLPKNTPASIRADGTSMPADQFPKHEALVRAAVIEAAHDSPTLRAVVSKDRVGREQTEFFGQKSSWMAPYKSPAMLTRKFAGEPVRLPTILS